MKAISQLAIFCIALVFPAAAPLFCADLVEVASGPTIAVATQRYREMQDQRGRQHGTAQTCGQPWPERKCIVGNFAFRLDSSQALPGQFLSPPFPAFVPEVSPPLHHDEFEAPALAFMRDPTIYRFAPVEQVTDGAAVLKRWRNLADTAELFDCETFGCSIVVHSKTKDSPADVDQLAYCTIAQVDTGRGAPADCYPIAISTSKSAWILAAQVIVAPDATQNMDADQDEPFQLRFGVGKQLTEAKINGALQSAWETPPLGLKAKTTEDGDVIGIAYNRESPILTGNHDTVTVRSFLAGEGEEPELGRYIDVRLATAIYVTVPGTGGGLELRLPSDRQLGQYIDAVLASIKSALLKACPDGTWYDDNTFACP